DKSAALSLRAGKAGLHQQVKDTYYAVCQVALSKLGGGHIGGISPDAEQGPCALLGFIGLLLAVDHSGKLESQYLFGLIYLA
ncbi:hypothetical protein, partial [Shigella sonnei]|uniref:hypothetical protein n=1 Tax=Shigella sonnei TaxID=624 RepID=UPI001C12A62B